MMTDYIIDNLNNKEFLTIGEAAFFLNISEKTIRRIIDDGEIQCHKIRKGLRLRKKDIERYLTKSIL